MPGRLGNPSSSFLQVRLLGRAHYALQLFESIRAALISCAEHIPRASSTDDSPRPSSLI